LPSSSFVETVLAREETPFLDLYVWKRSSGGSWSDGKEAILFFTHVATLCFLPDLLGTARTLSAHWKRVYQLEAVSGWAVMERSNEARWLEQAALADLGICFIIPWLWGVHGESAAEDECAGRVEVELPVLTEMDKAPFIAGWDGWDGRGPADGPRGSLSDPGHGLALGPCRCIFPSFRWSWWVAWQTLQTPLLLLAVCDRRQGYDFDCDIWMNLTEWPH